MCARSKFTSSVLVCFLPSPERANPFCDNLSYKSMFQKINLLILLLRFIFITGNTPVRVAAKKKHFSPGTRFAEKKKSPTDGRKKNFAKKNTWAHKKWITYMGKPAENSDTDSFVKFRGDGLPWREKRLTQFSARRNSFLFLNNFPIYFYLPSHKIQANSLKCLPRSRSSRLA